MEGRLDYEMGMTDMQLESVLLMIRGMAMKCEKAIEVVEYIDEVLDGKKERKKPQADGESERPA